MLGFTNILKAMGQSPSKPNPVTKGMIYMYDKSPSDSVTDISNGLIVFFTSFLGDNFNTISMGFGLMLTGASTSDRIAKGLGTFYAALGQADQKKALKYCAGLNRMLEIYTKDGTIGVLQGFNAVLKYMGKHPNKGPVIAQGLLIVFNSFGPGNEGYNTGLGFDSILDTIHKSGDNQRKVTVGLCNFLMTLGKTGAKGMKVGLHDLLLVIGMMGKTSNYVSKGLAALFVTVGKTGQTDISQGLQSFLTTISLNKKKGMEMARPFGSLLAALSLSGPDSDLSHGLDSVMATIGKNNTKADAMSAGFLDLVAAVGKMNVNTLGGLNSLLATLGQSGADVTAASTGIGSLFKLMGYNTLTTVTAANASSETIPAEYKKLSSKHANTPLIAGFEGLLITMGAQGQMVNDVSQGLINILEYAARNNATSVTKTLQYVLTDLSTQPNNVTIAAGFGTVLKAAGKGWQSSLANGLGILFQAMGKRDYARAQQLVKGFYFLLDKIGHPGAENTYKGLQALLKYIGTNKKDGKYAAKGLDTIFRGIAKPGGFSAGKGLCSILATIGKDDDKGTSMANGFSSFLTAIGRSEHGSVSKGMYDFLITVGEQGAKSNPVAQGMCDLFYGIADGGNKNIGRGLTSIMTIIAANGKNGLDIAKGFGGLLTAAGLAGTDSNIFRGLESILSTVGKKGNKNADATAAGFTDLLSAVSKSGNIKALGGLNSLLATVGNSGENVNPASLGLAQLLIPMGEKNALAAEKANAAASPESKEGVDPALANYTLGNENPSLVGGFSSLLAFMGEDGGTIDDLSTGLVAIFDALNDTTKDKHVTQTLSYVFNKVGKGKAGAKGLGMLIQGVGSDHTNVTAWGLSTLLETMAHTKGHHIVRSSNAFTQIAVAIGQKVSSSRADTKGSSSNSVLLGFQAVLSNIGHHQSNAVAISVGLNTIMKAAGKQSGKSAVGNGLVSLLGALGNGQDRVANATQGFCYFLGTVAKSKNKYISRGFNSLFSVIGEKSEKVNGMSKGMSDVFYTIGATGQKDISVGLSSVMGTIAINGDRGKEIVKGLGGLLELVGKTPSGSNMVNGLDSVLATIGTKGPKSDAISAGFSDLLASAGSKGGKTVAGMSSLLSAIGVAGTDVSLGSTGLGGLLMLMGGEATERFMSGVSLPPMSLASTNLSDLLPPAPADKWVNVTKSSEEESAATTSKAANTTITEKNGTTVVIPAKKPKPHVIFSAEDLKDISMSTDEIDALKLPKTKSSLPPITSRKTDNGGEDSSSSSSSEESKGHKGKKKESKKKASKSRQNSTKHEESKHETKNSAHHKEAKEKKKKETAHPEHKTSSKKSKPPENHEKKKHIA